MNKNIVPYVYALSASTTEKFKNFTTTEEIALLRYLQSPFFKNNGLHSKKSSYYAIPIVHSPDGRLPARQRILLIKDQDYSIHDWVLVVSRYLTSKSFLRFKNFHDFDKTIKPWQSRFLEPEFANKIVYYLDHGFFHIHFFFKKDRIMCQSPDLRRKSRVKEEPVVSTPCPQPVADLEFMVYSNLEFRDYMVSKYKNQTKDEFVKCFEPQGATLSHNIHFPAVEEIVNKFKNTVSETSKSPITSFIDYLKVIFGICSSYKFWLTFFFIVQLYSITAPDYRRTDLRRLKYFTLSVMMLCMVADELCTNEDLRDDFLQAKEHFWVHLAPQWRELRIKEESLEEMEEIPLIQAQGLSDFIPGASVGLMAILSVLTGYRVKEPLITSIIAMTRATPMQFSNVTSAIVFGFNSLSAFLKDLNFTTLSEFFYVEVCSTLSISKFCDKAKALITKLNAGDVHGMAYYAEVYGELLHQGTVLLKTCEKNTYDYRVISEYLKKLRDSQEKLETVSKSLKGVRIESLGVLLKGEPGTFKSVLLYRLARAVAMVTVPEEWREDFDTSPEQFIYSKPIDKFFDGYTNKAFVVLLDDFGQARDGPSEPDSEALSVIKMINTAEYVLPMANVDAKNNTYFRSPFVMMTTNLTNVHTQINSINSTWSLERRFNFEIRITIAKRYCGSDGKLDRSLLPMIPMTEEEYSPQGTSIPNNFWNIEVITRNDQNETDSKYVSFVELVGMIVKGHHQRICNYYVNRQSEILAMNELKESLVDMFPQRDSFANSLFKTYSPQSGLPGSYTMTQNQKKQEFVDVYTAWNQHTRDEFMLEYYNLCHAFKYPIDVFNDGFTGIAKHFLYVGETDRLELLDAASEGPSSFIDRLTISYGNRLRADLHPFKPEHLGFKPKDSKEKILETIKNSLGDAMDFVQRHKLIIAIGGGIFIGSLFFATGLVNGFLPGKNEIVAQSADRSRDRARVGRPAKTLAKNAHKISIRPQAPRLDSKIKVPQEFTVSGKPYTGFLGLKGHDVLEKVMKKYLFIMYLIRKCDDGSLDVVRLGHATNIKGRVFMMPMHFAYQLEGVHKSEDYLGANIVLTTVSGSTTYSCSLEDLMHTFSWSNCSAEKDFSLFLVESAHATSTGALNFFLKIGDLIKMQRLSSFDSCVLGTYRTQEGVQHVRSERVKSSFLESVRVGSNWDLPEGDEPEYYVHDVIAYNSNLYAGGDCGSINTILGHDFENRCIVGMHIAGDSTQGFSTIVNQEHLQALLESSYPDEGVFLFEEPLPNCEPTEIVAQGCMKPTHKINPGFIPGSITKSEIKKSKLFGRLPPPFDKVLEFPAKLKPFMLRDELVDPKILALEKYAKPDPIHFPEGLVKRAVASYGAKLFHNLTVEPSQRRKIPLEEALHAFENIRSVASSTSPGYPMCLPNFDNVKKKYYTAIQMNDKVAISLSLERIATLVQEVEDKWAAGIRPAVFYKGCSKDETRPLVKVLEGKTRMFSAGDFIYLLMCRMYFGAFMSSFFEANINVGSLIGVNPYSRMWDTMVRKLKRFSASDDNVNCGAGDYSGFDTCLRPQIMWEILLLINSWYGENHPDNGKRKKLFADIINSRHVINDEIYEWQTGMPSGNPMTSVINTMYNHIVFRMAYQLSGFPASSFNANVELMVLGDDNQFSVSDTVKEAFNELTLVGLMEQCGMVYTTELKGVATVPLRKITEVSLLKRSNRYDRKLGRWVAPISLDSIFCSLNWTKKGVAEDQITVDSIPSALNELALHGKEIFDRYAHQLVDLKNKFLPDHVPAKEIFADFEICYCDILDEDWYY